MSFWIQYKKYVLLAVLLVAGSLYFIFSKKTVVDPCAVTEETIKVLDPYMRGIFEKGQKVKLLSNWYACHPLYQGDWVYYRYSSHKDPVIRRAVAVGGDEFTLKKDVKHKAWNLIVNDEEVGDVSDDKERSYFFGGRSPPTLSLYEKAHKGLLGDDHLIVFSSFPPGAFDSGVFGVVSKIDLLGKIEAQ